MIFRKFQNNGKILFRGWRDFLGLIKQNVDIQFLTKFINDFREDPILNTVPL